jgi:hypothetical protein
VGQVELDRPATTGLEVDEQRAPFSVQDVPGVRLAVQQLLGRSSFANRSGHGPERVGQKVPVRLAERRRQIDVGHELLGFPHAIGEMRCRDVELLHAKVKSRERFGVASW